MASSVLALEWTMTLACFSVGHVYLFPFDINTLATDNLNTFSLKKGVLHYERVLLLLILLLLRNVLPMLILVSLTRFCVIEIAGIIVLFVNIIRLVCNTLVLHSGCPRFRSKTWHTKNRDCILRANLVS